jgi:hypothetical protein
MLTKADAPVIANTRSLEPKRSYSFLGCIAVCGVNRESYGSDRCSVLVLTGVFKFLLLSLSVQHNEHFKGSLFSTLHTKVQEISPFTKKFHAISWKI